MSYQKLNDSESALLRKLMITELEKHVGYHYNYGSNGFELDKGIDCSGLVMKGLWAAGFNIQDKSVSGLITHFKDCEIKRYQAQIGDLYFYGKPDAYHVCICFRVWDAKKNYRMLIGANSGDNKTKNDLKRAWDRDAYVKVIKDTYWLNNLNCIINPFLKFS